MANKYFAKSVIIDDIKFHSTGEGNRYKELKYQKYAGEIKDFELQFAFICIVNGKKVCVYKCDFKIWLNDGTISYEDYKGVRTPVYMLKKRLVEAIFDVKIIEVTQRDIKKIAGTIDTSIKARRQAKLGNNKQLYSSLKRAG